MYHLIPSSTNLYWPSTSQYRHILTQYHQVPLMIHHLVRHRSVNWIISLFPTHLMSHAQYTWSSCNYSRTFGTYFSLDCSVPSHPCLRLLESVVILDKAVFFETGFSEFDYTLHIGSRGRILTEIVWVTFELICVCLNKDFSPKKASTAYDLVETTAEGD